ncbi:serine protease [Staphylococcus hyicus]|uniref:Trypsin-like serine peptidase n=1 Tax=Staphylococcus hyicus TaxID=1284 RepID=A0ACD5FNU4_STAHY|nr:trypsin-like serine protease [Staphylococcus hyicus]AJC95798.1 putative glutamyl-endopeptidase [Staphylococcus hyicus]MDP4462595.1 trypsin-like serine protease [Staphylococcus hyicus]RTX65734.1 trypsin-like serine protease [Staphylococcus hyicus]SQE47296.1 trypsin family protein [Staphylococcus hyicus]
MKKLLLTLSLASLVSLFPSDINAQPVEDNRVLDMDVFEGNSLYTSKFEGTSYCTAVLISPNTALTAKHCEGDNFKSGQIGTLYPARSGASTQAGSLPITTYNPYQGDYDIALLQGTNPSSDMQHYIKKGVKISKERDINNYKGKEVYTIGYPQDKGENYQYKTYGTVESVEGNKMIGTNIKTSPGQSGSGLFLKNTDELIGILHGDGRFTAIDSTIRDWISNKTNVEIN